MTTNPFYNALAAICYIVLLISAIFWGGPMVGPEDTIFIPMAMLSLFVFSAATMGYIFLYQPLALFMDGKHKEAADLFLKTLAFFGGMAALLFVLQFVASR